MPTQASCLFLKIGLFAFSLFSLGSSPFWIEVLSQICFVDSVFQSIVWAEGFCLLWECQSMNPEFAHVSQVCYIWSAFPALSRSFIYLFMNQCIYWVGECLHMPLCTCEGRRTICGSQFFLPWWVSGIELGMSAILQVQFWFFFIDFIFLCVWVCLTWVGSWGGQKVSDLLELGLEAVSMVLGTELWKSSMCC